jgi:hypothetical protein
MPKYYVKSGQIKFVIDASDGVTAILAALKRYKGKGAMTGPRICVSETGFENHKNWTCYDTDEYLKGI